MHKNTQGIYTALSTGGIGASLFSSALTLARGLRVPFCGACARLACLLPSLSISHMVASREAYRICVCGSPMQDDMKASKESSSGLCPLGDVSLSAARWGVWAVACRVSDPARVSAGSRGGAPPGVLASARSARFARGAAPARSVADGGRRPSSHSVSGVGPSGSASGWSAVNASPPACAAMSGGSALCVAGRSAPPPGSPFGVGVGVRCGGPRISSAPTVGSPRCGWVGSAGGWASSFVGCVAPRAWPSATGGGSGRLSGPAGCGAPTGASVRAGSEPGPGPGAGRPGDDGSAGRAVGPVGGAGCRWGTSPSCVVAGRSYAPDVA